MECRCPLCKRSYRKNPKCGLPLFNSENECAICLEKPEKMLALPCGHQFCEEDLKKLGILKKEKKKKKKRKRDSNNSRQFRRRVGPAVYVQPSEGNRCGFCGHLGHTVRTCASHAEKCNCNDYKSIAHIDIQSSQIGCSTCMRRGHEAEFCSVIVLA